MLPPKDKLEKIEIRLNEDGSFTPSVELLRDLYQIYGIAGLVKMAIELGYALEEFYKQ